MNFKDFNAWLTGYKSANVKKISSEKLDEQYYRYIIIFNDDNVLECRVGDNAEIYQAWFKKVYHYDDIAYTDQEKSNALYDLQRVIVELLSGKYYEKLYSLNGNILKREVFLNSEAEKVNKFLANTSLKNRMILRFSHKVIIKKVSPTLG